MAMYPVSPLGERDEEGGLVLWAGGADPWRVGKFGIVLLFWLSPLLNKILNECPVPRSATGDCVSRDTDFLSLFAPFMHTQ